PRPCMCEPSAASRSPALEAPQRVTAALFARRSEPAKAPRSRARGGDIEQAREARGAPPPALAAVGEAIQRVHAPDPRPAQRLWLPAPGCATHPRQRGQARLPSEHEVTKRAPGEIGGRDPLPDVAARPRQP